MWLTGVPSDSWVVVRFGIKQRYTLKYPRACRELRPMATGARGCSMMNLERRRFLKSIGCSLLSIYLHRLLYSCSASGSAALGATTNPLYDDWASSYDALNDRSWLTKWSGLDSLRELAVSNLYGQVLEIGIGTGISLSFLLERERGPSEQLLEKEASPIRSIVGLDTSAKMIAKAADRLHHLNERLPFQVQLIQADILDGLPFENECFDCVFCAYMLCTVKDVGSALRESLRVLRPGGRLIILDHVRSDQWLLAAYQDLVAPLVKLSAKNCQWNRDMEHELANHSQRTFRVLRTHRFLAGTVELIVAERAGSA